MFHFALIGDVVASRTFEDREDLQIRVDAALRRVNRLFRPDQLLEATVGDEFQGGFARVGDAARATLLLRLELLKVGVDSRYGIGAGPVSVFAETRSTISQDGPGWWAARAAIDQVKQESSASRMSFLRTRLSLDSPDEGVVESVNAFLMTRDSMIDQMSPRVRRLLLASQEGMGQADIALEEGISQSAVSQSLKRNGAGAIEEAHNLIDGISI